MLVNILPHRPIEEWGALPIPPYAIYQQRAFNQHFEKEMSLWAWAASLAALSLITIFII